MKRFYSGINIQFPISRLILARKKIIETRTYPIPPKYLGKDLLMIETPGPKGDFKARVVAIIRFSSCKKYESRSEFYRDFNKHQISESSPWSYDSAKGKWGWHIAEVKVIRKSVSIKKRLGIKFTTNLEF